MTDEQVGGACRTSGRCPGFFFVPNNTRSRVTVGRESLFSFLEAQVGRGRGISNGGMGQVEVSIAIYNIPSYEIVPAGEKAPGA